MTDPSSPLSAVGLPLSSFLQSREWQEIQERAGRRTERIGSVLVIRHDLPFGFHYLYAPRPSFMNADFVEQVAKRARSTGAVFLKIDPADGLRAGHSARFVQASRSLQPESTIFILANHSDPELLSAMHPKTRYNIRVAERHGVEVRSLRGDGALAMLNSFWQLLSETGTRDGFRLHPTDHYRALFASSSDECWNELWFAEHGGKVLAAAIVNWFRPMGTATYLHGASTRDDKNVMAPYLLHWRIVQAIRERAFRCYDFGGIDGLVWPGLTRFKSGFGGTIHTFPPSVDYVFRPVFYQLYRFQHRLRHSTKNHALNA